ncbi:uncharacterized protein LOC105688647 isoform X1 [Athalia rosae]|uniref:uncharacterized protein LOC105688647 isoform X1 n=1 Tax=Athalia rosae TaxID=37344 RepID=UPI002033B8ED|nr:uncharacterized protein LOC105688647 isoform X1 [Athalia rosae]
MSNDRHNDHFVFSSEVPRTLCSNEVGPSWKMENILRLGLTNSLIPTPKSGKFAISSAQKQNGDIANCKVTKTEENKLRLILQYGATDPADDVRPAFHLDADATDKEKKININGTRAKITSHARTSALQHSVETRSLHHRYDTDKGQNEDYEDEDVHQEYKKAEFEDLGDGASGDFGRDKQLGSLTEAIRHLGSSVGELEPKKYTALGVTRASNFDAPSTHPKVVTPTPQSHSQSPSAHDQSTRRTQTATTRCARGNVVRSQRPDALTTTTLKVNKEDVMEPELKEKDEHKSSTPSPELLGPHSKTYHEDGSSEDDSGPSSCSRTHRLSSLYHGTWPVERGIWNSQQISFTNQQSTSSTTHNDIASVMSFSSGVSMGGGGPGGVQGMQGQRRLGAKVDVVYSLLGMLGGAEGREDMSATLLSMSSSTDSCLAMRQSGCLPLLVQLIHAPGQDPETRERASQAIHNIVHSRSEERAGRREARVLRLLEQLRDYCQTLRTTLEAGQPLDDFDRHPGPTIAALMKLSFDEAHRHAMCQLGGLHAVAELIEMDHAAHGSECDDQNCVTLRRYAGMALTNLTFGDGNNKALLCSFREFMKALVAQLRSPSDDLRQVTASVLRNLSWRADSSSKQTLREVGAVVGLTMAAMEGRKESTLKSILSALWNLSAHCSTNKIDICAVEGALAFLVDMLSYKAPSKTLAIVENAGGILRNVSSHVAVREDYRSVLRERGCLQVLLRQLRSPSLTVVSNACGALWNLSARCPQDQRMLWDLGAVPMLRSLVHSKHKMISMGSGAALKNLLGARPGSSNLVHLDSTARGLGLPTLPTLVARRQRALEQEIDQNLAETCDNIEPSTSPTNKDDKFGFKAERRFADLDSRGAHSYQMQSSQPGPSSMRFNTVARSESRESIRSITSTHSDTIFERVNRHVLNGVSPTESQVKQQSSSLHSATGFHPGISAEGTSRGVSNSDRKYVLRYKNATPERQRTGNEISFNDTANLRCTTSTMSWASAADQEAACSQILMHTSIDENSSSSELYKSSSSNRDDIKSQYLSKDCEPSGIPRALFDSPGARPGITSSVSPTQRFVQNTASKDLSCQQLKTMEGGAPGQNTASKNSGITGAIKREITLPKPIEYRLRYVAHDLEEDDKQHSGYCAESEDEFPHNDDLKKQNTERAQYRTRSSKINGGKDSTTSASYEAWVDESTKRVNYCIDEASNSSSGFSSLTTPSIAEKSTAAMSNSNIPQRVWDKTEETHNVSKVAAKNDICTLARVSDDDDIGNTLMDHQEEKTSITFPQYDSLGLLSSFEQESCPGDHSSLASNSSNVLPSFQSASGACSLNVNACLGDVAPASLTLDDEFKIANDSRLKECSQISIESVSDTEKVEEESLNPLVENILGNTKEDNEVIEVDTDSDEMLTACNSSEMQTKRHRQSFRRSSLQKSPQPVSNLARYQTSSALNQFDTAGQVSPKTEMNKFRQSASDVADKIVWNVAEDANGISRPLSCVSISEHEQEVSVARGNSLQDFSSYCEKDLQLNESKIQLDPINPKAFSPILENLDTEHGCETTLVDGPVISIENKPSPTISETMYDDAAVSDHRISREAPPTLENANNENQSTDVEIQSHTSENHTAGQGEQTESLESKIMYSVSQKTINEDGDAANRTMFDFCISSDNCEVYNGIDEKIEASSPGALSTKLEDDTSNTNISEEENLSDEVMSPSIDPLFSAVERAANSKRDRSKNREETEEEYRRQRDPDAMIASLDRLTATLVQQTEAMRERESSAMKQSVVSDTWNEDSPNDVSFPSISVSAPLIASFKSDIQEDQMPTMPEEYPDESTGMIATMTVSRIIELEANKLADAVNARVAEFDFETMSMTSMDLDAIKPPSTMGSLVSLSTSLIGPIDNSEHSAIRQRCNSTSLPPLQLKNQSATDSRVGRKKSLPAGVVAKRALSQYQNHTGSLENLLNETCTTSISHLDNVKPPSMMDELPDAMDMENSMLSVASITSEVADSRDQDSQSLTSSDPVFDLLKPVANILSMTCMRYAESMQVSENNSLSECLENINPPSLFNEVSEMDESTIEPTSDTFCSDTLCMDNELHTEEISHGQGATIDRIEECDNDTDDATTPIPSEYCVTSSAESTPKKRHNKNHLTPKQKRQLAKERYKTYTIAAEMVKKEEERRKLEHEESRIGKYTGGKCSPFSKLTPKQRRQEDRARFQTQVLNYPFPAVDAHTAVESQTPSTAPTEAPEVEEAASTVKSGIPMFRKLSASKTMKQKRAENKDRYRTRTLDDEEAREAARDADIITCGTQFANSDASLETILNDTPKDGEDGIIECARFSSVSNDSDQEQNLRMRFANGLSRRLAKPQFSESPGAAPNSVLRFNKEKQLSPLKSSPQDLESTIQQEFQQSSDFESDEESNSANEQSQVPKRPRIVKPGTMSRDASLDSNATDKSEPESPKTIRGRRKALYSNPTTRKSTPQTSPSKKSNGAVSGIPIGRSNTSPLVRGTRATTLRQTHNPSFPTKSPQKLNANSKIASPSASAVEKRVRHSAPAANRTSIPQKGAVYNYAKSAKRHTTPSGSSLAQASKPAIKPLERQGTFTKEEPEVENAPTVLPPCSPSKSKIAKPIKTSPSKTQISPGKTKPVSKAFQAPQPKFAKASSFEKDQTKSSPTTATYQRRSLIGSPIKHSPSNQSLQSNDSGRIVKKTNNPLGQRSNSNSSIVSNSSTGVQSRRTTKEATSKIASLWKRVEESKTKQRFEKNDTRHWITSTPGAAEPNSPVVTSKPPTFRLIRSSTFEGVPKDAGSKNGNMGKLKSTIGRRQSKVTDVQNAGPKYRNSCDLSEMSIAEMPAEIPLKSTDTRMGKKETVQIGDSTVILRKHTYETSGDTEIDPTKRLSRLGSFIRVDPPNADGSSTQNQANINSVRAPASAIVPPFNYNPKQSSPAKASISDIDGKLEVTECQMEITTSSMRVTTV